MILISSERGDFSTNQVIDCLIKTKEPFIRLNKEDDYEFRFKKNGIYIIIDNKEIHINSIKSFWYRRGKISYSRNLEKLDFLASFFIEEQEILNEYINQAIGIKKLSSFYTSNPNKFEVLRLANTVGLKTPKTYIVDNKSDVINLSYKHPLITKGITSSSMFSDASTGEIHLSYTEEISLENINILPDNFFPSLFQEKINKAYEIRTFFLDDNYWSMAIFSQKNTKTEVDFRKYDNKKPNRKVPYKLPVEIEKMLNNLMKKINLNSGSIDILVEEETRELYFLEVNPIGQFGMTSHPCNYNLEEKIAHYLRY